MRNQVYRLLAGACLLAMTVVLGGQSALPAAAQGSGSMLYFPLVFKAESVRIDDFSDTSPSWTYVEKEPGRDGRFFHRNGMLIGEIRDNSAIVVGTPGWRPLGDFRLEVDARFSDGEYTNGMGIVWGGNDDWSEYYALILTYYFAQPQWAVIRYDHGYVHYLDDYDGVPGFVRGWDGWNRLRVDRVGEHIVIYVNDRPMPGGAYLDGHYGTNRQVGLILTSWELNAGEMEFDDFTLTPLSMPY